MALKSPALRPPSPKEKGVARNVIAADPADSKLPPGELNAISRKRPRPEKQLSRQVSNEAMCEESVSEKSEETKGRGSPCRCVSEFDSASSCDGKQTHEPNSPITSFPNPLHNSEILAQHRRALTIESDLFPMRLILSRLMAHPTYNRKGLFNSPVDPVALNLPDYFRVITSPMDLGTIKARLHAVAYKSRQNVAEDIRLVFRNAMKYNPPQNLVHICAKELLAFFEDHVESFVPDLVIHPITVSSNTVAASITVGGPATATRDGPVAGKVEGKQPIRINCSGKDVTAQLSGPPSPPSAGQATRTQLTLTDSLSQVAAQACRKRKKRGSKVNAAHQCQWCEGRACGACQQGCLHLEPTLLICNGAPCAGAKVRKGALFYIARDGSRQYCQRCYTGLPAVLPNVQADDACRYKRDLLKRKNDEEIVESWITCKDCSTSFHQVCVMHNELSPPEGDYRCPGCSAQSSTLACKPNHTDLFSFTTGESLPVPVAELTGGQDYSDFMSANSLPETPMSRFIQQKVQDKMNCPEYPNAEKTVSIRVISECSRFFDVPEVIRRHFAMQGLGHGEMQPPTKVGYRSKCIALFQRVDGLDVCIFCMYVQEYDGSDTYPSHDQPAAISKSKRVYIAYLDSVEHFRPRVSRTAVYHELLVAYLASARERGYQSAHIWACPPTRGNSFVFWNHPSSQRTPTRERLIAWYHGAISRAISCGVVADVKSLFESHFERDLLGSDSTATVKNRVECPPLFEGDFWIEEATRLHAIAMSRISKSKSTVEVDLPESEERCPARQVAFALRRVMADPISLPFRKPVNAAALNLKDYHKVISQPMDLGTIYSSCLLGEYSKLQDLVSDFNLVVSNAKRYNPKGHFVHGKAEELEQLFDAELRLVASTKWNAQSHQTWKDFSSLSLSLDFLVKADNDASTTVPSSCDSLQGTSEKRSHALTTKLTDGPLAVEERMAGKDKWMIEKKGLPHPKPNFAKRKKSVDEEPPAKRRRQTWLGDEVGEAVRRMRTSFFTCSLVSDTGNNNLYREYVSGMPTDLSVTSGISSNVVNARHGFLEFSQLRNLEFDTLRHAKYSTAILLYCLHNKDAPGTVPLCSCCQRQIRDVRWHKLRKVVEMKQVSRKPPAFRTPIAPQPFFQEELCAPCHSRHTSPELFLPLQVTLTVNSSDD